MTFSRLNVQNAGDEQFRFGYHGGAFYNIPVSSVFSVQSEVLNNTKGTRTELELDSYTGNTTLRLNYLDVPILGVLEFGEQFEIMAGPYVGFLLSSNFLIDVTNSVPEGDLTRESFSSVDYGAAIGFGLNFGAVQTGATYYLGIQDVSKGDNANQFLGDPRNRYLQLFVAFRIGNHSKDPIPTLNN